MLLNNLYDKLPWRTKIYGIGIYGVQAVNNITNQAREIVYNEVIYVR